VLQGQVLLGCAPGQPGRPRHDVWLLDHFVAGELLASQVKGHDGDHGPVEVGLVVGGEPFAVADGAPVAEVRRGRVLAQPPPGALGSTHSDIAELSHLISSVHDGKAPGPAASAA